MGQKAIQKIEELTGKSIDQIETEYIALALKSKNTQKLNQKNEATMNLPKGNKISLFIGVAIGALYGLFCQFVLSRDELKDWFTVMTMGFVFILPIALGVITLYFANTESQSSWVYRIFMPWATASLCLLLSFITGMEGTICLIMAVPIYLPLASLGGVIGGAFLLSTTRIG